MTHPRVTMFLRERDRARARGDRGIDRALTADLLRLGVPVEATLADPTGKHAANTTSNGHKPEQKRRAKPRCEHGNVPERCQECAEA